jgi:hypothetical protein
LFVHLFVNTYTGMCNPTSCLFVYVFFNTHIVSHCIPSFLCTAHQQRDSGGDLLSGMGY